MIKALGISGLQWRCLNNIFFKREKVKFNPHTLTTAIGIGQIIITIS